MCSGPSEPLQDSPQEQIPVFQSSPMMQWNTAEAGEAAGAESEVHLAAAVAALHPPAEALLLPHRGMAEALPLPHCGIAAAVVAVDALAACAHGRPVDATSPPSP